MTAKLAALVLALVSAACQTLPPPDAAAVPRTAAKLTALHGANASAAVKVEARRLAEVAHAEAAQAARDFRVDSPSWAHNLLVNVRLKPGGLCWQYMERLHARLSAEHPRHFALRRGVKAPGDMILEHNCVVVTIPGAPFSTGLILDPWKTPGVLLVYPAAGDKRPWRERAPEEVAAALR